MKKKPEQGPPPWREVANKVAAAINADIFLLSGNIDDAVDEELATSVDQHVSRPNVMLLLTTPGGSPDLAYRIARGLQRRYKSGRFVLFVHTICKSAGTLVALGADEIVMSDGAELGPLDVQISKHGEVGELSSGLTPVQTFTTLQVQTYNFFDEHFKKLRYRFGFPTKLAAETAAKMATGAFRPIYAQIDPMRLGEIERSMMIAKHYGERVSENTDNLKEDTLNRLLARYPSHEFVIDREEALTLFSEVRPPTPDEFILARIMQRIVGPRPFWQPVILHLSSSVKGGTKNVDSTGNGAPDEEASEPGMASTAGSESDCGTVGIAGSQPLGDARNGQGDSSLDGTPEAIAT